MKIRNDTVRRRRSPLALVLPLVLIVIFGVLAAAWVKGDPKARQRIEIPISADQLGR